MTRSRERLARLTFLVLAGCLLAPAAGSAQAAAEEGVVVYPEKITAVEVSNTDVNRIVCPTEPGEIVYSKEKGLTVSGSGRNLFLKFLVSRRGEETFYNSTRNEIYLTVGEDVYSLILYPRSIPGQTIWLQQSRTSKWEEVGKKYGTLPLEAKLVRLIREAYKDTFPEGVLRRTAGEPVAGVMQGLAVSRDREMHLEGQGLLLKVYTVKNVRGRPLQLSERFFLGPQISKRPVAIALEKVSLEADEKGRLFVVERVSETEKNPG